jgi:hypothetical protein
MYLAAIVDKAILRVLPELSMWRMIFISVRVVLTAEKESLVIKLLQNALSDESTPADKHLNTSRTIKKLHIWCRENIVK